ncbi:hypothetical protein HPULCUR_002354 [Helicostylum pulchrum]|uniref:Uncharacterized protein n=1 Tax=Helicostylum pulchrum TaxID=562976 RepID=A0ABP9XQG5_9FUNG
MSQSPHPETFTRIREETPSTPHGSRTLIVEDIATQTGEESSNDEKEEEEVVGVLRLRGDMNSRRPRAIHWDESSSESESSSSSDSDNSSSSEDERPHVNGKCTHKHTVQKKTKKKRNPREVSPNAYERQPVYKGNIRKILFPKGELTNIFILDRSLQSKK